MSEAVFDVRHVSRSFGRSGEIQAVKDATFTVHAGQRLGIVGASGSGKSTLIRMMAALDRPSSGEIDFAGRRIDLLGERDLGFVRAGVQMVFQDPRSSLDPRMKVGDIITEPLRSRLMRRRADVPTDQRARLIEVMEAVGLPSGSADRYPHEFSGGQRQRIAIARALAPHPSVLIADEPVSALDVSVRAHVLNLINDLVDSMGLTLVFVSHDLMVVRHVCDTVMVMRSGAVLESGPTADVFGSPQHSYTQTLVAAVPAIRLRA